MSPITPAHAHAQPVEVYQARSLRQLDLIQRHHPDAHVVFTGPEPTARERQSHAAITARQAAHRERTAAKKAINPAAALAEIEQARFLKKAIKDCKTVKAAARFGRQRRLISVAEAEQHFARMDTDIARLEQVLGVPAPAVRGPGIATMPNGDVVSVVANVVGAAEFVA
jgi:hypothetical protein